MTLIGHSALFTPSALYCTAAMFQQGCWSSQLSVSPSSRAARALHLLVIQQPRPAALSPVLPPWTWHSVSASILCKLSEPSIRVCDLKCPLLP